jgi:hypothetical protein
MRMREDDYKGRTVTASVDESKGRLHCPLEIGPHATASGTQLLFYLHVSRFRHYGLSTDTEPMDWAVPPGSPGQILEVYDRVTDTKRRFVPSPGSTSHIPYRLG